MVVIAGKDRATGNDRSNRLMRQRIRHVVRTHGKRQLLRVTIGRVEIGNPLRTQALHELAVRSHRIGRHEIGRVTGSNRGNLRRRRARQLHRLHFAVAHRAREERPLP